MSTASPSRRTPATRRSAEVARLDDLLEQTAKGDTDAFAALYDQTASRVFGLSLRVLRNRSLAEDAAQEAYITIWRSAARFDRTRGSSMGWIFMTVHRTAIDHVRSVESRSLRDDRYFREHSALHRSNSDPTRDFTDDLANASHQAQVVRAALSCLSAPQHQALELAYFDGCTYAEIAAGLGIPLGTAKSRIRAAQIRLRDALIK